VQECRGSVERERERETERERERVIARERVCDNENCNNRQADGNAWKDECECERVIVRVITILE